MTLEEIRKQYPQYNSMSDEQLRDAMYQKFYSDKMSIEDFDSKIGYKAQPVEQQPQKPQGAVDFSAAKYSGIPEPLISAGEAVTTAVTAVPAAITGGWDMLRNLMSGKSMSESVRAGEETVGNLMYTPKTQQGQELLAGFGEAMDSITKLAKVYPSAGYAALESLFTGKTSEEELKARREELQNQSLGETTEQLGAPPLVSAAAETLGQTWDMLLPAGAAKTGVEVGTKIGAKKAAAASEKLADIAELELQKAAKGTEAVTQTGQQNVAQALQTGNAEQIAQIVNADPKILQAIDDLGIDATPVYGQISQNPQYRSVEGSLRTIPGADIDVQAREFIEQTAKKADDLIGQYGGTRDKAYLSQQFESDMRTSIKELEQSASDIYSQLDDAVAKTERAVPQSTIEFIAGKADELGGIENLDSRMKKLIAELGENPTIGLIDQRRKDVGQALRSNTGPFKDAEQGQLKAIYGRLTDDMNAILEEKGFKELSDAAKALVVQRKTLESNVQDLLGKDLQRSLMNVVGTTVKGVTKNPKQFVETMKKIPPEYRQQATISALNDIFRGTGQGAEAFNANSYLKFMNELNAQPTAKALLMKELPEGMPKALDSLAAIAKGIVDSQSQVIRTGVNGMVHDMFKSKTGLLSKMLRPAVRAYVNTKTGGLGGQFTESLMAASKPHEVTAALIATPQFRNTINAAIKDNLQNPQAASEATKRAEAALMKSKQYKAWADTLSESDGAAANAGFLTFLLATGAEQNDNNNQQ